MAINPPPPPNRDRYRRKLADKAGTFLLSARLLYKEGDWEGAVSRAYYAVRHKVVAKGIEVGQAHPHAYYGHPQVADLAGALIRGKIQVRAPNGLVLPNGAKEAYTILQGAREKADYHVAGTGKDDAEIALEIAGRIFESLEGL